MLIVFQEERNAVSLSMLIRIFTFVLTLFFILSCSTTVDFHGSTNTFTTPEVVGKNFGLRGGIGLSNSTKFELGKLEQAAIFSSQVRVDSEAAMIKDNHLTTQIGLGLFENIEVYYRAFGDAPDPIGVKWQVLGSGFLKKEDGLKLLVFVGASPKYSEAGSLTASNGSGTTRTYNTSLDVTMMEAGLSVGYRANKNVVYYLAPFYRSFDAKGSLTNNSYATVDISKEPLIRGVNLGISLNSDSNFFLTLESGYAHSQYTNSIEKDDYSLGGILGFTL